MGLGQPNEGAIIEPNQAEGSLLTLPSYYKFLTCKGIGIKMISLLQYEYTTATCLSSHILKVSRVPEFLLTQR